MRTPLLATLFALAAIAQPPAGLKVTQASSKQVQLAWTGGKAPYVVERKPLGGKLYVALPDSATPAFTDSTIAPYDTYVYRVRTRLSPTTLSEPSGEVTAGPPPVGFSLASPLAPAVTANTLSTTTHFGARLRPALDANGDVALAYLIYSPKEEAPKSFVEFVSWNRAAYRWNKPRQIVVTGDVLGSGASAKSMAFAHDDATNTWGLAYTPYGAHPRIALSTDDGATWKDAQFFDCGEPGCAQITYAMGGGNLHIATLHNTFGMRYFTGKVTDEPKAWKTQVVPKPAGTSEAIVPFDIALDSAGKAGLAFWSMTDSYNIVLSYWRPGASPVKVLDSNGKQNDAPDVDLEYAGTSARVLANTPRNDQYFARYDQGLWVTREQGGSFSEPVNLPSDGNQYVGYPALAVSSKGQMSITGNETGGNDENVKCGIPKLFEQPTDAAKWTICSPVPRARQPYAEANYPRIVYAPNDSRYLVFVNTTAESKLAGVIVWRER